MPAEDNNTSCRRVLTASCSYQDEDEHVGADVLDHLDLRSKSHSLRGSETPASKVRRIFSAPAHPYMFCVRHRAFCGFRSCDVDISGFPCVDWSPSGKQLGVQGSTFPVLLSLLAWHRASQTRIIFLENVPEFPEDLLRGLMQDLYTIEAFVLEPRDVGCTCQTRLRAFFLLTLRGKATSVIYYVTPASQGAVSVSVCI